VIVPGHGERLDAGLLDHTLALLADFKSSRRAAARAN